MLILRGMAAGDGPRFLLCCRGRLRTGRAGQMGPATLRGDGGAAAAACVLAREVPGECRVKLRVLFFRRSSPSRSLQPVSKSPRHRLTTCTHPDRAAGSAVQGRQRRGACPHRRAGAAGGVRCRGFLDGALPSPCQAAVQRRGREVSEWFGETHSFAEIRRQAPLSNGFRVILRLSRRGLKYAPSPT